VRIHLLGVRGSTPTPGAEFARHGGHTSCVAIEGRDGSVRLVLDAGTGLRGLTRLIGDQPFRGTLAIGHLHWDHTHGLPFCRVADHPDATVRVMAPSEDGRSVDELLANAMSPPNFPIGPDQLRGAWTWDTVTEGRHDVEGFDLLALEIPHKGGRTFGYRVSDGDHAIAYLSDHMPQAFGDGPEGWGEYHDAAMALADGVDLLVHDAQYTAEELPTRGAFGHAAAEYAVALGESAGAKRVLLFHHDPARTDDEVDAIVARFTTSPIPVSAAVEGTVIAL
jgi:phosphoribosyl 1,2-cyclic phosphodiesterase